MATTIYRASAPDAPGRVLALRDAAEAEVLARQGWRVRAETR